MSQQYQDYTQQYYQPQRRPRLPFIKGEKINGLEWITLGVVSILILSLFTWGYIQTSAEQRDKQRLQHISSVIDALDKFYEASSGVPSERKYPIAVCSSLVNEVDYELTLRQHLAGQRVQLETHSFIDSDDFPRDPWGDYSVSFASRSVPFRCPERLGSSNVASYADNYPSCEFSQQGNTSCYLYTSSSNGDTYSLSYWSESQNAFVVYRKFRTEDIEAFFG